MIENLKELEKLLKLCRKQGVTEIKLHGCELKLGDLPVNQDRQAIQDQDVDPDDPYANFPPGMLTPEQLAFYSSGGTPETDPNRNEQ